MGNSVQTHTPYMSHDFLFQFIYLLDLVFIAATFTLWFRSFLWLKQPRHGNSWSGSSSAQGQWQALVALSAPLVEVLHFSMESINISWVKPVRVPGLEANTQQQMLKSPFPSSLLKMLNAKQCNLQCCLQHIMGH